MTAEFNLPIYIDLSATCLYAMTGALLAIRRHYDVVGLFVLALVSGVGGGLIRDGIFIQKGPPVAMSDGRYLVAVIIGCIAAALARNAVAAGDPRRACGVWRGAARAHADAIRRRTHR